MADAFTDLPEANTIDPAADWLGIDTSSLSTTQKINRNTLLGLSSAPVGLTDSQTLTNKTLTSPTISGPTLSGTVTGTYTLGGTPTFPSTVVTTTGTQTLTNKTLTSPTISSPTITNATISADAVTGYTSSSTGTIYGISVTSGAISSALSLGSTLSVTGATSVSSLTASGNIKANTSNPVWQYLNKVSITGTPSTSSTTYVLATGVTCSVTVPSAVTKVKIIVNAFNIVSTGIYGLAIYRGATSGALTTLVQDFAQGANISTNGITAIDAPSAGSYYYSLAYKTNTGTLNVYAGSGNTITLEVECC